MNCPSQERLLQHVDKDLSARDADALSLHLARCARCREQVEGLSALVSELQSPMFTDFDAAQHAQAVLGRLDTSRGTAARSSRFVWGAALACAAAALIFWRSAFTPAGSWQARGGAHGASIARCVSVQLYELKPIRRALTPNACIQVSSALTAGFRNLGTQTAFLLLFAVDQAGTIHWIAPPYTQAATVPSAAEISP